MRSIQEAYLGEEIVQISTDRHARNPNVSAPPMAPTITPAPPSNIDGQILEIDQSDSGPVNDRIVRYPVSDLQNWLRKEVDSIKRDSDTENEKPPASSNLKLVAIVGGGDGKSTKFRFRACVRELTQILEIPEEYCYFSAGIVKFNSFPAKLVSGGKLNDLELGIKRYCISSNVFGVAWMSCAATRTTVGIAWCLKNHQVMLNDFFEDIDRHTAMLDHPLLLGLLGAQQVLQHQIKWVKSLRKGVSDAQLISGFHGYQDVPRKPLENPAGLSPIVSGLAAHVATTELCMLGMKDLADFLMKENMSIKQIVPGPEQSGQLGLLASASKYIEDHSKFLWRSSHAALQDAQSCQKKASIVIQGLFNLTAKKDQEISIQIAKESMIIAEESKKDSTSMKAIAGVTMIFLPGTFVAVSSRILLANPTIS